MKSITAKKLKDILNNVPDNTPIYVLNPDGTLSKVNYVDVESEEFSLLGANGGTKVIIDYDKPFLKDLLKGKEV